jgi:hypothetical protein
MKETIMYCHKHPTTEYNKSYGEFWYDHFYNHPFSTRLCDKSLLIYKVRVRELQDGEQSTYWGWWSNKETQFIFVQPNRSVLSVCFAYGIEASVEAGEGTDHNVMIEELETIQPETIKMRTIELKKGNRK